MKSKLVAVKKNQSCAFNHECITLEHQRRVILVEHKLFVSTAP